MERTSGAALLSERRKVEEKIACLIKAFHWLAHVQCIAKLIHTMLIVVLSSPDVATCFRLVLVKSE